MIHAILSLDFVPKISTVILSDGSLHIRSRFCMLRSEVKFALALPVQTGGFAYFFLAPDRGGNSFKGLMDFHLEAKARICP
jgi:hypothetical protein